MTDSISTTAVSGQSPTYHRVSGVEDEISMDDFFKLLTAQLTAQDPLSPIEDAEFIGQMANFSSLSQMETLAESMKAIQDRQDAIAVQNLIGSNVTARTISGELIEGIVTHMEWIEGTPTPFIGTASFPYSGLLSVAQG